MTHVDEDEVLLLWRALHLFRSGRVCGYPDLPVTARIC